MKITKLFVLLSATLMMSACGGGNQEHTHTYSNEWSHDDVYHWHNPTCEFKRYLP